MRGWVDGNVDGNVSKVNRVGVLVRRVKEFS